MDEIDPPMWSAIEDLRAQVRDQAIDIHRLSNMVQTLLADRDMRLHREALARKTIEGLTIERP